MRIRRFEDLSSGNRSALCIWPFGVFEAFEALQFIFLIRVMNAPLVNFVNQIQKHKAFTELSYNVYCLGTVLGVIPFRLVSPLPRDQTII